MKALVETKRELRHKWLGTTMDLDEFLLFSELLASS